MIIIISFNFDTFRNSSLFILYFSNINVENKRLSFLNSPLVAGPIAWSLGCRKSLLCTQEGALVPEIGKQGLSSEEVVVFRC